MPVTPILGYTLQDIGIPLSHRASNLAEIEAFPWPSGTVSYVRADDTSFIYKINTEGDVIGVFELGLKEVIQAGGGAEIVLDFTDSVLTMRTIVAGAGVTIAEVGDTVEISSVSESDYDNTTFQFSNVDTINLQHNIGYYPGIEILALDDNNDYQVINADVRHLSMNNTLVQMNVEEDGLILIIP